MSVTEEGFTDLKFALVSSNEKKRGDFTPPGPQVYSRKEFNEYSQYLFFQFVSKDNTHLIHSHNQKSPYQGQCVLCFHIVELGSCLLVWVFFFTNSHGSTLNIFLYVSFT